MKVTAALVAIILAVATKATPQGVPSVPETPTLENTVEFLNKMGEPENRLVSMANKCEFSIYSGKRLFYALVTGWQPDKDGIARPLFTIVQDSPQTVRFNLGDIDPTSIGSFQALSMDFAKSHSNMKMSDVSEKNRDLTVVHFRTTDLKESIESGGVKDSGRNDGTSIMDVTRHDAKEAFSFRSKDRAERFVTALVRAVKLCGGKPDAFPPTGSK